MNAVVAEHPTQNSVPAVAGSLLRGLATFVGAILSGSFIAVCWMLYWLTAIPARLTEFIIPRAAIERAPLCWLAAASTGMVALTQTAGSFAPDYTVPAEIGKEVALWFGVGLLARAYLIYTELPATFEGLKAAIDKRPLDRWFAGVLAHPLDAIFVRIWLGNTLAILPVSVALFNPASLNYFVIAAYSAVLLMIQFPHECADHNNIHVRIFTPRKGVARPVRWLLAGLRFHFEYVLTLLTSWIPDFYRIQHVYVHHVEDNGPDDTQSTLRLDRTSFLDFSRHALGQGVDLVSGAAIIPYLVRRSKWRQLKELIRGLAIWYALLIALAVINPLAAGLVYLSRFLGGNIQSLVAFYQHGVVDPHDVHDVRGNTIDFHGPEHGGLGNDYHVEHHLKPARHWSQYYEDFKREIARDDGHRALVMNREMFAPLAFVAALWRRDYATVARHARLGRPADSPERIAALIELHTKPVGTAGRGGAHARFDAALSSLMAAAVLTSFQRCGLSEAPAPPGIATA